MDIQKIGDRVSELTKFCRARKQAQPNISKPELARAVAYKFSLEKERSVWKGRFFSVRFSSAKGVSFSNVVLSLSVLKKYDRQPFIIIVVRQSSLEFFLANTTFLKKISHSSHKLAIDNIRGSFLGHDIMRAYDGIPNIPKNFEKLFSIHEEFTWEENLERLVEATGNIVGYGKRYNPTPKERQNILDSIGIAAQVITRKDYALIKKQLEELVLMKQSQILSVGKIDNVNERGNAIEQIITGKGNAHSFEDMARMLTDGIEIKVEIKSTLLHKSSNPKAYNIDKLLRILAQEKIVCVFCFIGIDLSKNRIYARVISIFDKTVLKATRIQFHWAGRNSRGVTQLTGESISPLITSAYQEDIEIEKAKKFLDDLLVTKK